MEIGSLAEWVEGFGELLAVSVALFLPYYQQRQDNKKKNQRAKQVITSTAKDLLNLDKIQNSTDYLELRNFVAIYRVLSTNDKVLKIIEVGSNILDIIGTSNVLTDQQKQAIQQKLENLTTYKI
ncbi:hypothetical protein LCR01_05660 [Companilactobacillus crustorum]|uniref:Uncharacterized protein n=3 Tax=Companilactobacillus TaxID=2767879 RepID=A0A837RIE6_9LACO|nr:hypothetical protein [Companilactobacillus crustorum]APU71552.1 hypothetical protein BI355_1233 [Companilactobacillus crustorum]KRK43154.1 hypothetical protein FD26_GL000173 [Companilactobacillus crustorum JCM 15951]KRO20769.1 hypothetical protein IV63_GL000231 [Companilactobacillus crustorum]WDT66424.1 hypothetical protein NV391_04260 [Companilactobacillus crustorum]GEO76123.1 hypothetical protein LCR01_05660 [Companilactobacillus crustorum]